MYKSILVLLIITTTLPSFSQVVNIEKQRAKDNNKNLQGFIDLSLNYTRNNSELLQAQNKIQVQYFKNRNTFLGFSELSQVKADGKSYLNDGFLHLRYNYKFKPEFVIGEMFTQYQYNRIKKMKQRYLAGLGPRFRLADTTNFQSYFGPLIMYEYESLTDEITVTKRFRLSTYLSLQFQANEFMSFNHITYYQPWIADFENYRISSETSIIFKITKNLSYKVLYNLSYDSKPPEDVNDLFYTLSNGISYKF